MPALAPSHESLAKELAAETIGLVEDARGIYCSGVWISDDEILTANHCVDDTELNAEVSFAVEDDAKGLAKGQSMPQRPAKLVARDAAHDLALLQAESLQYHGTAQISLDDIAAGQRCFAEGNPLGYGWSFSSGDVAAIRYISPDDLTLWYVQATAPISPGSSGGGLFDAHGRLIGIARAYFGRGELMNLFIHRDHIVAFLINAHAGRAS